MQLLPLSRLERRRLSVFFSSLVVAIFAWLFFALSANYEYETNARVNYVDPPLHKAYLPLSDDTVTIRMVGTGWELLFSKFKIRKATVNVSLKNLQSSNFVTFSSQLPELNKQFHSRQKISAVLPDTLFFDFSRRMTKKVAVKVLYELSFRKSYGISGPIKVSPDTVMISGTSQDLKNIRYWLTDTLHLRDLHSAVNTKLGFINLKGNNVNSYPEEVKVEIPVEEFTEQVLDVPLTIRNANAQKVKLIPEKVKVTVMVPLSKYQQSKRDSFNMAVDLQGWLKYKYPQLPVIISKLPQYSKMVKVEPQVVDFLIEE